MVLAKGRCQDDCLDDWVPRAVGRSKFRCQDNCQEDQTARQLLQPSRSDQFLEEHWARLLCVMC